MKNKWYLVTTITLIIALMLTTSYIVYDKFIKKETKKEVETTEEIEEENTIKNIEKNDVLTLLDQIEEYNTYLSDTYPIKDKKDIDNQKLLTFAYIAYFKSTNYTKNITDGFSASSINKIIKQYFGNDLKYKNEDIMCFVNDGPIFKYNADNENYSHYGEHGHGGLTTIRSKTYFNDGTYDEKTKTYVINVKILYTGYLGDTYGPISDFYTDATEKQKLTQIDIDIDNCDKDCDEENYNKVYNKYKDYLPTTTFTFIQDSDNNLGLKSVTIN